MKRQTLVNGLLSLTVVSVMTACVDDKYDLSDIDTTSRFTVDNLTVPVNLSEIKLKNVVNLDDNENISIVNGEYAISKSGEIAKTEFNLNGVHVADVPINSVDLELPISDIPSIPGLKVDLERSIPLPLKESDMQHYNFNLNNIDPALLSLDIIKTTPISIKVDLSIPGGLLNGGNRISFTDLNIKLPKGLMDLTFSGNGRFNAEDAVLTIDELPVESDGKAHLVIGADGLNITEPITDHNLHISGDIGLESANIDFKVTQIEVPNPFKITIDYSVSEFDVESFSGQIDYKMNNIDIAPISLSDLPDFLDNPETNLIIANPQILVGIANPVGKWLNGMGKITLTSVFKNGDREDHESDMFELVGDHSDFAFCTPKDGFTFVPFDGLRYVLSKGNSGLPSSIEVNIHDIKFSGHVEDFPLGNLGSAEGNYEFSAPLGFGEGSRVIYETTEDGWGGDDLDKVNITKIHLNALCSTNLPVSVQLSVVPVDKNGNEIKVDENSGKFHVSANSSNEPVELLIQAIGNGTIKDFDGVKFKATIEQNSPDNTGAIGPDLHIALKDIKVTVDGYYETDF